MASAEQLLATATSKIGTVEVPRGSNCQPFSKVLGRPCEAWCADFVAAMMKEVGLALPSDSAYTVAMFNGFQRAGTAVVDLKNGLHPGDVVFFDFVSPFNTRGIQHVGLFVKYLGGGYIETIEGNTSDGDAGSQDNGDGVYRRKRPLSFIVGAGRPSYEAAVPVPVYPYLPPPPPQEDLVAQVVDRPQGGFIVLKNDGAVFAMNGAPYLGGGNNPDFHLGNNVAGAAWTPSGNGYWIVARDGAVYGFGDAPYRGGLNGTPHLGARYVVGIAAEGNGYVITAFDPSNDGSPFDEYAFGV